MKLVLIDWVDSSSVMGNEWHSFDDFTSLAAPQKCRSVGWLINDTEECKTLIGSMNEEQEIGSGDMTILNRCITKMVVLHEEKGK